MDEYTYQEESQGRMTHARKTVSDKMFYFFEKILDVVERDAAIMRRELDIFLGTFLFLVGLLNFHSGRYCDGNTADYLSCTRPVTYYYYTWFEMGLIILGIFLIILWFLKREER